MYLGSGLLGWEFSVRLVSVRTGGFLDKSLGRFGLGFRDAGFCSVAGFRLVEKCSCLQTRCITQSKSYPLSVSGSGVQGVLEFRVLN